MNDYKEIDIKGEDVSEIKGDIIDGVDIVLKDGRVIHLNSNMFGDFVIKEEIQPNERKD